MGRVARGRFDSTAPSTASEDVRGSFVLRLVIKHPSLSLIAISNEMPIERHQGHGVGEKRKTPKGTELEGVYGETFWGYSEHIYGRRDFLSCATSLLDSLQGKRDFFLDVVSSGGKVAVYVDILDGKNIGDVLTPKQLESFSLMGVELGVEFFP